MIRGLITAIAISYQYCAVNLESRLVQLLELVSYYSYEIIAPSQD